MCNASRVAKTQRDAVAGETLAISTIKHVAAVAHLGAFHDPEVAVMDCVVCVHHGVELHVTGIPEKLRKHYGLKETEEALFVDENEGADWSMNHDLLLFKDHQALGGIPLVYFAKQGISVTAHTIKGVDHVVEQIKKMALAAMDVSDTPTFEVAVERRQRLLDHVD